ncbi:MAG: cytochrome c [Rhodospirillaceae bacterium]|nr:MAG: cytochrome c [Rhodospirillaceae bacterium]
MAVGGGRAPPRRWVFPVVLAGLVGWAALAPASPGDPAKGREVFTACRGCHDARPEGRNRVGPNLWGVVERPIAVVAGFVYSPALKERGGVWTIDRLDRFLAAPAVDVPKTRMSYAGLKDAGRRADLLAYLVTLREGAGSGDVPTDWQGLPEGQGRQEVFETCQACHSLKLVQQQRLDRRVWDEVLGWMVTEKRMLEPAPEVRQRILEYLVEHYGPSRSRGSPDGMPPLSSSRHP